MFSGTDVILRQSIELVEREEIQDGKKSKYKAWECDEVQFHYNGEVTEEEIEADFDYWFAKAEEVPDPSSVEDLSLEDARKAKIPGNRKGLRADDLRRSRCADIIRSRAFQLDRKRSAESFRKENAVVSWRGKAGIP